MCASLSLEHQALLNLAEHFLSDAVSTKRTLKTALYLMGKEGGDIHIILPAVLFHTLDISFSRQLLTSLEIYNEETLEKIISLIAFYQRGVDDKPMDSVYCIFHDALLLNSGRIVAPKEMMTGAARQLLKERRSALRLFFGKKESLSSS